MDTLGRERDNQYTIDFELLISTLRPVTYKFLTFILNIVIDLL